MERKLINYLPYVVRDYDVFKAMMEAEQAEFETAWASVNDLMNNQFIATAGNTGLSRWEKILAITPKGTDTQEERRFRVRTRINEQLPFTFPVLRAQLATLCGPEGFSAALAVGTYLLIVRVALTAKSNLEDVKGLLERIVPANIAVDLSLLYNQHQTLARYTHKQLDAFTHDHLRNEVMD